MTHRPDPAPEYLDVFLYIMRDEAERPTEIRWSEGNARTVEIGRGPFKPTRHVSHQVRWNTSDLKPKERLMIYHHGPGAHLFAKCVYWVEENGKPVESGLPTRYPDPGQELRWGFDICWVGPNDTTCSSAAPVVLKGRNKHNKVIELDPVVVIKTDP